MKRLLAYAEGNASWRAAGEALGSGERDACRSLHAKLLSFIDQYIHPLLDRVTSREMQGFTMHDRGHGLKVAHLMWHILKPSRRELLSPAEIALLVLAAHLHDLGMGLSDAERKARLASDSDLWDRIEDQSSYMRAIDALVVLSTRADIDQAAKAEAAFQVQQAQEALLCADSRERHATRARYEELIASFEKMNRCDPVRILDVHSLLSFGNDSFEDKLIEICVSHNEGAQNLLESDPSNPDQLRFPTEYAVGSSVADTRFVAATLRLADVLDFDRERTPEVLSYINRLPYDHVHDWDRRHMRRR